MLDGVFAFVLYDTRNKTYMAARDAIGVNPLYIGWGGDGRRPLPSLISPALRALPVHVSVPVALHVRGRIQTKRGRQPGTGRARAHDDTDR